MSFPSTTIITARCPCRANDFSIAVPSSELPLAGSICHCDSCRHLTGCLFFAAAKWPYTLPQSPHLKSFSFSDSLNTYFCDICGTQIFSERVKANSGQQTDATETNIVYVKSGALEETEGVVKYETHLCIGDTTDGGVSDWISEVPDTSMMKRWKGMTEQREQVPVGWRAQGHSTTTTEANNSGHGADKIRGSCKCGGVSFHITRPDAKSADWSLDLRQHKPEYEKPKEPWWLSGPDKDKYTTNCCCCASCRFASGVDFVSWTFVPSHNIRPAGDAEGQDWSTSFGTLKTYASSERSEWCFCSKCGAMCFLKLNGERPNVVDVASGLLWSEEGARAEDWLWWLTEKISFDEEGGKRPLVEALRSGLKSWNEVHGNKMQFEEKAQHLGYK